MAKYRLRFFFEWGTRGCLWYGNDAAAKRFDAGPIDYDELPISDELRTRATGLAGLFQTALNWAEPNSPGPWSQEESESFDRASRDLAISFREELGAEFDVDDENNYGGEDPDPDRVQ